MVIQHHPGVIILNQSGGAADGAALGEDALEPVPEVAMPWCTGHCPLATEILHGKPVFQAFFHVPASVRGSGADETDLPLGRDHQFRMVLQELHLHFHGQDGVCMSMKVCPLGHALKEAVQRRIVNLNVAQEVKLSAESAAEIGL